MIDVARTEAPAFEEPPNTWKPVTVDGGLTALYTCPNGHGGLIDEHTIHADGRVEPSVVCTEDGCDFHDYIRLVGWEPRP